MEQNSVCVGLKVGMQGGCVLMEVESIMGEHPMGARALSFLCTPVVA